MEAEQAMMKRIGVIADTFKTHVHFGNKTAADAQVMVDLDQLRREFPDQARTDAVKRAQQQFRDCMNRWSPWAKPECRHDLIGALDYLLL
jgi:hypothetical protein